MSRYFPAALVLEGANALVIGGDADAAERAQRLRAAGARVAVVAEQAVAAIAERAARGEVRWWARAYRAADLRGVRIVVLTGRDAVLARDVHAAARRAGAWLCAVDLPAHSDFVHVATADVGPLAISVSSHGAAPALAARVRDVLARGLDEDFVRFADAIVAARRELRDATASERRAEMRALLDGLELAITTRYPAWHRREEPA